MCIYINTEFWPEYSFKAKINVIITIIIEYVHECA